MKRYIILNHSISTTKTHKEFSTPEEVLSYLSSNGMQQSEIDSLSFDGMQDFAQFQLHSQICTIHDIDDMIIEFEMSIQTDLVKQLDLCIEVLFDGSKSHDEAIRIMGCNVGSRKGLEISEHLSIKAQRKIKAEAETRIIQSLFNCL